MRLFARVLCLTLLIAPLAPSVAADRPSPPPQPIVKPEIACIDENDIDSSAIDKTLKTRLVELRAAIDAASDNEERSKLRAALGERVKVQLVFSDQITQAHIDSYARLGGRIRHVYGAVSYGWNGDIPLESVEKLKETLGDRLVAVIADRPMTLHLDEATRTGRVRPIWSSGFAGNPAGYSGSPTTTIAIIDTGVDDSHADLTGRLEYWQDYTYDEEPSARDIVQHGTHVAGIACGTGVSSGVAAGTLYYTDSGDLTGVASGSFFPSVMHIPGGSTATFSSTASWLGGGSTDLYQVSRTNGSTGGFGVLSASTDGSSPITEANSFSASASNQYSAALVQNPPKNLEHYAVSNWISNYPGVGDGFEKLRGVAPGCRWAGAKTFANDGSGSGFDTQAALDDLVAKRGAHNIKVVNMSLGLIGSPGVDPSLRAKVNTMVNNGIVVVASAGNDGPGSALANQVDDPGRAALAITVAASNDINQLTRYSSSGFSSPSSSEDFKPDVTAPGGSDYYSCILSTDTNDADAELVSFSDQRANDYLNIKGTSMAAPFVAGAAALVIDALESNGFVWSFSNSSGPLLVKMLLCATCTESNSPREASSGANPTLGRAASPKDLYEGYGLINPDAAIEAVATTLTGGTVSGTTGGQVFERRAWAWNKPVSAGERVLLCLDVPAGADYDLYLYSGSPDAKGNPVIRASGTSSVAGNDEQIDYTAAISETLYVVLKRVSGNGGWSLTLDNVPPGAGTCNSPQYTSVSPIPLIYSGVSDVGCAGLKTVYLWYKKELGGAWTYSGLSSATGSGSFGFNAIAGEGTYCFALRTEDNIGNISPIPSGDGACSTIYDITPPSAPGIPVDDGAYSGASVRFDWVAAADSLSGIYSYNCRIGTTPGGADVFSGGVGAGLTKSVGGSFGSMYYCVAQAVDRAGNVGDWSGESNGIACVEFTDVSIAEAKLKANAVTVGIPLRSVTAVFGDHFYIEEPESYIGIRVTPSAMPIGLAPSSLVSVGGTLQTADFERHVSGLVEVVSGTPLMRPVVISNLLGLGGENWFYDQFTGAGQVGVLHGHGCNTIGLLVTVAGEVVSRGIDCFDIEDGSTMRDLEHPMGERAVARVICPDGTAPPPTGAFAKVTGVSQGVVVEGHYVRAIRPRGPADIHVW